MIVSSLLVGGFLTSLFIGQMSWKPFHNCQVTASTARTDGCAVMEYGYPKRWLSSDVNVGEQNVVFTTSSINKFSLIYDWLVLSGLSFVVLYLVSSGLKLEQTKQPKSKRK